jgi:hypothetical protein
MKAYIIINKGIVEAVYGDNKNISIEIIDKDIIECGDDEDEKDKIIKELSKIEKDLTKNKLFEIN